MTDKSLCQGRFVVADVQPIPPGPLPPPRTFYVVAAWHEVGEMWTLKPGFAEREYLSRFAAQEAARELGVHWRFPLVIEIALDVPDQRNTAPLVVLGQGDFTKEIHEENA